MSVFTVSELETLLAACNGFEQGHPGGEPSADARVHADYVKLCKVINKLEALLAKKVTK